MNGQRYFVKIIICSAVDEAHDFISELSDRVVQLWHCFVKPVTLN